jgi:hypothetical protein
MAVGLVGAVPDIASAVVHNQTKDAAAELQF